MDFWSLFVGVLVGLAGGILVPRYIIWRERRRAAEKWLGRNVNIRV